MTQDKSHKFYYLTILTDKDCNLVVTLNGFPVQQGKFYKNVVTPFNINPYLVANGNTLQFSSSDSTSFIINAELRSFQKGEIVTPDSGNKILLTNISTQDTSPDVKEEVTPLNPSYSYRFTQSDFNFSALLLGQPLNVPEAPLKKYALFLQKLYIDKDIDAFIKEMEIKLRVTAIVYGEDRSFVERQTRMMFEEGMNAGLASTAKEDDIGIRAWCNKRIYELYVKNPEQELIVTKPTPDGSNYTIKVFVSVFDRKLGIAY